MRKLFYPRLAAGNLRLNRRFYAPYLLTVTACSAMFYNLCFIKNSDGLHRIGGDTTSYTLDMLLSMGIVVVALFSAIFLFYSNSLLMKQRKRELGLYAILGMQKRNIARVMLWESLWVNGLGILLGLAVGILLSKLALLVLCAIMDFPVPFGFAVSLGSVLLTLALFAAIGALNLLVSLLRVSLLNPIELLHGSAQGEKPPRANWPLTVLGLLTLGAGYAIAITVKDPVQSITFFFEAVLLVIVGTYCLFIAGSIAALRLLQRKKSYYYRLRHFTAISGMIYRMRQNAAGLASICILSTMVLVTISTTVSLNVGVEDALMRMYPNDIILDYYGRAEEPEPIDEYLRNAGISVENLHAWQDGHWYIGFDAPELNDGQQRELARKISEELPVYVECRASVKDDFYGLYGGLLFIGLFLGLMFLMSTAMIIYYKQISEGYEDKKRYDIMQKVGMTLQEVRASVSTQILTVFFLPLAAAVLHLTVAFPMIRRMLLIFGLDNIGLFALCTGVTVLIFAAVYAAIYGVTARMYYHIIKE